jgi:hypothetical protein
MRRIRACEYDFCDTCHDHDAPRGHCPKCPPCPVCERNTYA